MGRTKINLNTSHKQKCKFNEKTIKAMLEAENISKNPNIKGYDSLNKLFESLKDEGNR